MRPSVFGLNMAAVSLTVLLTASSALAENPCAPIREACLAAGFAKGGGPGLALFPDCMNPIVLGKPQPANAAKPLPTVDPAAAAACKAAHPDWGKRKSPGAATPAEQGTPSQ